MARQDGLKIIENDRELAQLIRDGILVPLPDKIIKIDRRLDKSMRHCTPWTRDFLLEYGKLSQDLFKRNLKVNSAVRTVDFQVHLRRTNGNAAEADGSLASSHLTGATIDIAKKGMPLKQLLWMREQLEKLELLGLLEATEEMHQAVFHVMVFEIYSEGGK